MSWEPLTAGQHEKLVAAFGERLQMDVPLASYTSARIGGKADYLVQIKSADELAQAANSLWEAGIEFRIIGGGSNILVADEGVREVVLLNKARQKRFLENQDGPRIWAESGANLGTLARLAGERGWSGLEWAASVPGTLGGAVVGNAGAHGYDMAVSLAVAEILQHGGKVLQWRAADLDFSYRSSRLKHDRGHFVVLAASLNAEASSPEACKARMREYAEHRAKTQPAGASMGSMFKNPSGDYAGRLIEEAGLKGFSSGAVQISERHANFFMNHGGGTAQDVWKLISTAREQVLQKFGVTLELEVELVGAWQRNGDAGLEG